MDKRRSTLIVRTALVLLFSFPSSIHAFDKDFCEFATNDYSLEWAFEPNTEKIVFVLKQNATEPEFWTGVGFNGSRSSVDFVGVLVRNGQVVMADAYLNSSGVLYTDVVNNIQTIGHDYNGKTLLVKFARSLNSPDMVNDQSLDGCTTFFLPREAGKIEAHGIRPKLSEFHRFKVCDIKHKCSIDMAEKVNEKLEKVAKKPKEHEKVKIAQSVDLSANGDPCSFVGKDYLVNWTYAKQTDRIQFTMELPAKQKKWWSAVGIGEWMADMDIGVLFLEDGKVKKLGDYLSTSYGSPNEDKKNDWKLESSKKSDDKVTVKFSRAVETKDKKNDRSMDGCVLFQFGANLGKYEDEYLIQKHDEWPDLYKACDLRENCAELSFEKRAKNRKNKNQHKEEEEHAPENSENNDEHAETTTVSSESVTTPKPEENEKTEQTTEHPSGESGEKNENKGPKKLGEQSSEEPTTTAAPESKESQEDQAKTTTEHSEISEELSSGEEPKELLSSTLGTITSSEILPLDDGSGQEHEHEATEQNAPSKLITSAPESTPLVEKVETTASSSESATTPIPGELKVTEQTTPKSSEESVGTTVSNALGSAKHDSQQCDPQRQDLNVCQSYMDNYLAQVREWAARHDETMEAQYGKACALLSAVPHVPQLCCRIFQKTCNAQVSN